MNTYPTEFLKKLLRDGYTVSQAREIIEGNNPTFSAKATGKRELDNNAIMKFAK